MKKSGATMPKVTADPQSTLLYKFLFYGECVIIPLWSVLCLWVTVKLYFRKEIQEPVETLSKASEKILGDDLDFKVECSSDNELGKLCRSFEEMRKNLYDSNYRLWKSLEERKRLNSAFSHDLRTPITVLKGYTELMNQFDGQISHEKQAEIMNRISCQIDRLERYTEKMSSLHKMEDIIPDTEQFSFSELCTQLKENGRILCGDTGFVFSAECHTDNQLYTDTEIVLQVFMNLASNAVRYAAGKTECFAEVSDSFLKITVTDDGCGFSEEALRKAWQPFYRDGDENDREHFGLGLYICRLLCKKTGGDIVLENSESGGGKVTAYFSMYPSMSADEALYYLGSLSGNPSKEVKERADMLLKKVNLENERKKKVKELSGGMKRRLGIAQALLNNPKVLIVDEPTAGLDPEERIRFRNLLCEAAEERIVILSTHIVGDIEASCEQIAVMDSGRILWNGTVQQLTDDARGHVYTANVEKQFMAQLKKEYIVTGMLSQNEYTTVRIVSDAEPDLPNAELTEPDAESAYMYCLYRNGCEMKGGDD